MIFFYCFQILPSFELLKWKVHNSSFVNELFANEHVFAREAFHLPSNSFLMNLLLFFCETLFFWIEDD